MAAPRMSTEEALAYVPRVRELIVEGGMKAADVAAETGLTPWQVVRVRTLGGIPSAQVATRKYDVRTQGSAAEDECPRCRLLVDFRGGKPVNHNRLDQADENGVRRAVACLELP